MELIDRIFLIVFARCRRKATTADLESVWRFASFRVSGYLGLPTAALTVLAALILYSAKGIGAHIDEQHKIVIQVAGAVLWLAVFFILEHRFKQYLSNVPKLSATESDQDRRLFDKFRMLAIGVSVLVGAVCFVWYKVGQS